MHQHATSARFCVLGFFLDEKRANSSWVDHFFPVPGRKEEARRPFKVPGKDLAPKRDDLARYYRYQGSLTTDPSTETVNWVVFPSPLQVSQDTFRRLRKGSGGARVLQSRDDRLVLLMTRPSRGK